MFTYSYVAIEFQTWYASKNMSLKFKKKFETDDQTKKKYCINLRINTAASEKHTNHEKQIKNQILHYLTSSLASNYYIFESQVSLPLFSVYNFFECLLRFEINTWFFWYTAVSIWSFCTTPVNKLCMEKSLNPHEQAGYLVEFQNTVFCLRGP